ncbi:hypothetical protein [Streptomyces sp. WG7]|uniref:hypothetical protein n=1 Tax=Streptomyces sp. WG7 TaxID=3417650 RepID=UPI003CEDFBF1
MARSRICLPDPRTGGTGYRHTGMVTPWTTAPPARGRRPPTLDDVRALGGEAEGDGPCFGCTTVRPHDRVAV